MAGQLTVEASPDALLTAPPSSIILGGPLPIDTGSTLVLSGHHFITTAVSSSTASQTAAAGCVTTEPGGACSNAYDSYWAYEPNISLAILFAALFFVSLCAHVAQAAYWKKLKPKPAWPWPLLVGLACAMSSFAVRAAGSARQHPRAMAASEVLGILAPLWISLFHYLLLGQMATVYIPPDGKIFRLSGSRIALAFVCLSVEVFLLEGCGAAMLLLLELGSDPTVGAKVMVAGIACQQAYMLVFAVFAVKFHSQAAQLKREHYPLPMFRPWRATLVMIYVSLALLTVRNAFRLVQFAAVVADDDEQGGGSGSGGSRRNSLVSREWCFCLFDAVPIWCCGVIANLLHPARATLAGPEGDGLIPTSRLHPLKRYGPQKLQGT